jgi:hypothetical protein
MKEKVRKSISTNRAKPLKVAIAGGICAIVVDWLVQGSSSPLDHYFLWHTAIPNFWGMLNIIPVLVSTLIAGNPHSQSEVVYAFGVFIQWSLIVYVICSFIFRSSKSSK